MVRGSSTHGSCSERTSEPALLHISNRVAACERKEWWVRTENTIKGLTDDVVTDRTYGPAFRTREGGTST